MSDLTTAWSAIPRKTRQRDRGALPSGERDLIRTIARALSWFWVQWRRREIIRVLNKVDDRLLRDAGIERGNIDAFVDSLIERR
jgi:uncharacterized protein YjiS (DUF1127 family)